MQKHTTFSRERRNAHALTCSPASVSPPPPPLSFLSPSHPPCHPILQSCPLPGTPPCRRCQPASKTCNLHSEPLPAAAGLDMLSSNASWHGLAYPPPSTVAAAVLQIAIC